MKEFVSKRAVVSFYRVSLPLRRELSEDEIAITLFNLLGEFTDVVEWALDTETLILNVEGQCPPVQHQVIMTRIRRNLPYSIIGAKQSDQPLTGYTHIVDCVKFAESVKKCATCKSISILGDRRSGYCLKRQLDVSINSPACCDHLETPANSFVALSRRRK